MNFKDSIKYLIQHARHSPSYTGISESTLESASCIVEQFVRYLPEDFTNDKTPNIQNMTTPSSFCNDEAKMVDFRKLSKDEFLSSYSYITEEEYNLTRIEEKHI